MAYNLEDLTITGYSFLGNGPDSPMSPIDSFKPSKSPGRRNAEGEKHARSHYRNVPISRFTTQLNSRNLLGKLFNIEPRFQIGQPSTKNFEALLALEGALSQLPVEEEWQKVRADERKREELKFAEIESLSALAGTWKFGDADNFVRKQRGDE